MTTSSDGNEIKISDIFAILYEDKPTSTNTQSEYHQDIDRSNRELVSVMSIAEISEMLKVDLTKPSNIGPIDLYKPLTTAEQLRDLYNDLDPSIRRNFRSALKRVISEWDVRRYNTSSLIELLHVFMHLHDPDLMLSLIRFFDSAELERVKYKSEDEFTEFRSLIISIVAPFALDDEVGSFLENVYFNTQHAIQDTGMLFICLVTKNRNRYAEYLVPVLDLILSAEKGALEELGFSIEAMIDMFTYSLILYDSNTFSDNLERLPSEYYDLLIRLLAFKDHSPFSPIWKKPLSSLDELDFSANEPLECEFHLKEDFFLMMSA